MSMDLIMVLRGQYTAGEDMEQRLQDLTEQSLLAKSLGYWGVAVPKSFPAALPYSISTRHRCWPISRPRSAISS